MIRPHAPSSFRSRHAGGRLIGVLPVAVLLVMSWPSTRLGAQAQAQAQAQVQAPAQPRPQPRAQPAATIASRSLPSAVEVVARYVDAIGGAGALEGLTSVRQTGTLLVPSMGLSGVTEALFVLPDRSASRLTISGLGELVVGTDGDVAWSVNPMQGPRLLADQELAAAKEGADFVAQLVYPAERFREIEVVGVTEFAGEPTYSVKFVSKATSSATVRYFSVATGLLRGSETTTVSSLGSMASRTLYSDYQSFGRLKFPTKTETAFGPQSMVLTTTSVEYNTLSGTAIAMPESVRALLKK